MIDRADDTTPESVETSATHAAQSEKGRVRAERALEIARAIMLAIVAVASAWSGYQATRWTSAQSTYYAQAAARRVEATNDATQAGQLRLYDLSMVNNWLNAYASGDAFLQDVFERRFRPEFRPIFDAWIALDPFHNPDAPPGPLFMPQYASMLSNEADQFNAQADQLFSAGQAASERSGAYVLNTVILALVLFMMAMADRFEWHLLRVAVVIMALLILLYAIYHLVASPLMV